MKSILMLLVSLSSMNSAAQAQNLFSPYSINELNLVKCMNDHQKILDVYGTQLNSEIGRGLKGLQSERRLKTLDELGMNQLEKTISMLIMKKILIDELNRQAEAVIQNPVVQADPRRATGMTDLLKTESLNIEINREFKRILKEASEQEGLGEIVVHTYLEELKTHAIWELGENTLHAIGNGLILKIIQGTAFKSLTMNATKTAVVSFGASVVKGAGIATLLTLLTEPLKGGRNPPETIWLDILSKHPELVINPEWMNEAGSPDAPWPTHCYTINRKGKELTRIVNKLIQKEESRFMGSIASIFDANETRSQIPNGMNVNLTQLADHTAVYRNVPTESRVPTWALTK